MRDRYSVEKLVALFRGPALKGHHPGPGGGLPAKAFAEPSGRDPQHLTLPATVNREVTCLKTIFNKAVKNGKAESNPVQGVKLLKENNERDRILSPEEYTRLLVHCPEHLKSIVKLAYYTGMRQGEILNLTWDQVDLKRGLYPAEPGGYQDQ